MLAGGLHAYALTVARYWGGQKWTEQTYESYEMNELLKSSRKDDDQYGDTIADYCSVY